jgi:hypothetical protein
MASPFGILPYAGSGNGPLTNNASLSPNAGMGIYPAAGGIGRTIFLPGRYRRSGGYGYDTGDLDPDSSSSGGNPFAGGQSLPDMLPADANDGVARASGGNPPKRRVTSASNGMLPADASPPPPSIERQNFLNSVARNNGNPLPFATPAGPAPSLPRQNFLNSVAKNNGNPLPYAPPSAPSPTMLPATASTPDQTSERTFAAAKSQGVSDTAARRQAYIASHGGMSPYNMLPAGAESASTSASPGMLPASPLGPLGSKTEGTAYSRANGVFSSKVGQASAKLTALTNELAGLPPSERSKRQGDLDAAQKALDDAYAEQQQFRGSSVAGFNFLPGQPPQNSQAYPAKPPPGMVNTPDEPAGTKKDIDLTTQQLRAMFNVVTKASPGVDPNKLAPAFAQHVASEYGIAPEAVRKVMGQWSEEGTLGQGDFQYPTGQMQPATPQAILPMSDDRGGVYNTSQGRVVVDANGRAVGGMLPGKPLPMVPVTETGPEQGYTPIVANRPPRQNAPTPAPAAAVAQQPAPQQQGAQQAGGVPLRLRNGRMAYAHPDGTYTDEQGRLIR